MKVSVVMNTVNENRRYLMVAIESYLVQPCCELIVSTVEGDRNISFIKQMYKHVKIVTMPRDKHPIHTGTKSPKGSFLQLNNALPHLNGDWFTFASGNDVCYNHKLQLEVEKCIENKKEVCYSAYDYIDENGKLISHQLFHDYDWNKHLVGNFVADCSMVSMRLVKKYLPFRVELNNYAYWDLWLRIRKVEGNVFHYNPIPTWGYRQDRNSMHVQRWKSEEQLAVAERDKNKMLSLHR